MNMQALSGPPLSEVMHILKCMAWRRAREGGGTSKVRSDGEIDRL